MTTENLCETILNSLDEGIYLVDKDRTIVVWNKGAESLTGFTSEEILGRSCFENLLDHVDLNGNMLCLEGCPLHRTLDDGLVRNQQVFMRHKKGNRIPCTLRTVPIYEDDKIVAAVEIFSCQQEKTQPVQESLSRLSIIDQLTGVPNRKHCQRVIDEKYQQYRFSGDRFGIMIINLDEFSAFNELYGYETGNELLRSVAQSLQQNIRGNDFVGRWSGAEFTAVLEIGTLQNLGYVSEKLRRVVENTQIVHQGETVGVTMSVGGTIIHPTDTVEALVQRCELQLMESKKSGKNRVVVG